MERLTKREYGEITYSKNRDIMCGSFCNSCSVGTGNCNTVKAMVEKLAEYEDLEEQGRLLRLPCKVGDSVYRFGYADGKAYKVQKLVIRTLANLVAIMESGEFDKSVFLHLEEAENKLKEMETT